MKTNNKIAFIFFFFVEMDKKCPSEIRFMSDGKKNGEAGQQNKKYFHSDSI